MEHAAPSEDNDVLRLDLVEVDKVDVMPQEIVLAEIREVVRQRTAIPVTAILPVQAIDEVNLPCHGCASRMLSTPLRTTAGATPYMQGGSFSPRQQR